MRTKKYNISRKTRKSTTTPTNTWKTVAIHGSPFERGQQHGEQLFKELRRVFYVLPFAVAKSFNVNIDEYYKVCKEQVSPTVKSEFPEFYKELEGIVYGASKHGLNLTIDQLIAWNSLLSMNEYFNKEDPYPERCSAFIATGNATANGEIVMAHNTHCDLVTGSLYNIILYVNPEEGFPFVMQTAPGFIASGTDFFITSNGIVGCETTISNVTYKPHFKNHYPYFCRIRQAIQYGKSLDDYAEIMTTKNAGDYPCSWLFGDIYTNEIMLCELGLKHHNIKRTKNGIYHGMNSAIDDKLRKRETADTSIHDISQSSGARNKRLKQLLYKKYFGKINTTVAKRIIADHYDVYDEMRNPSNLTICNHLYEETQMSYPHAAQDGKIVDSKLAKEMKFLAIWGSSCGKRFSKKEYIKANPSKLDWEPYLTDYPKGRWRVIHHPDHTVGR
jgi:hypothetical protein